MSEEIKEILNDLNDKDAYIEDYGYQYKRISLKDTKLLLDYITYLQQENERLKENAEWWADRFFGQQVYDDSYRITAIDYRKRIGKAIEYNYELQERYCHSAIFDELVASKVYEITEKELNILQNGSDEE